MSNFVNFRANLVEFEVRKVISCCATLEQSDNISVKTLNIVKEPMNRKMPLCEGVALSNLDLRLFRG